VTRRIVLVAILALALAPAAVGAARPSIARDDAKHVLTLANGQQKLLEYHYAPDHFLTYIHPLLSPSGKDLLVRLTEPYPHHRSFWFTDKVQLDGHPAVNFYAAHYKNDHRIRHDKFLTAEADAEGITVHEELVWEMNKKTPVLKERRLLRVVPLPDGEYIIDVRFAVTAAYGAVHFVSDASHYAWPYLRMHSQFSVAKGGRLVNSEGGVNQKGTHNKVAAWCDYSNTVDGKTEGVAFFSHTENAHPHRWLTRDYGCFGPRRVDAKSGKKFTLKKSQSITRRVGILVHNGDEKSGKVAERYTEYIRGKLVQLEEASK